MRRVTTPAHVAPGQKRCAVVGSPIGHSLSPVMHRAAYAALGLGWEYDAIEIPAGGLAGFLDGLDDDWAGLSVTAPLKREAAACATSRSTVVDRLGVANTLIRDPDEQSASGTRGWHAVNTDVPGAVAALRERGIHELDTVRFLGAGATVDSVLLAVRDLGATTIEAYVRNPDSADLDPDIVVRHLDDAMDTPVDLVVSTIPTDAVPAGVVAGAAAVFDVVYDPWPTPLAEAAAEAGLPVVTGIDLLAHQAVLQVGLMTARSVEVGLLRDAAMTALAS